MGVWIETRLKTEEFGAQSVTPCMGVGIETHIRVIFIKFRLSHPVWVCGLKHLLTVR